MTFGHQALHLEEYLALLAEASEEVLHRPLSLKKSETDALITGFLRKNGYPSAMPSFVELRCYHSGEIVLLGGDVSPYPKFGLRLLMPSAVEVVYDLPLSECYSSVQRAVAEAAKVVAESRGAKVAVRVGDDGFVRSVDDAELFVVKEYTIITPSLPKTVEGRLIAKAIERSGLQIEVAPVPFETLADADEIFYADHRGVTALGALNGRPLMHILAEKIAGFLR